ncbi:TetR/AcrR family transcriptional regulator [Bradyrhizobium tropiciagri]|uniref:TetR/AcrR family transcriptional regulator n=1 Tax=Bradyrhizobium tropiciagri TaxID=312253 RepID=UPI001BAC84EE|nr:TetR/AcrR family transcriptional regulator [Bradyrhizobium tropiciagri]MBR0869453.1 TetR/AcrR family transcriptional regulator [Bradyrhizobium tropiciagri]
MARPREFDEVQVLEAAGAVFWAKGFEATSTRDLVESTGLTQSSIYAAFGDKRGIFLRSLRHYLDSILLERIVRLERTKSPGQAIVLFFREIVDRSLADPQHRGCLLVNATLEATADDHELQAYLAGETAKIEQFFLRCVSAGQAGGEIATSFRAEDHARHLLALLLGLRVLARVRPDAALLNGLVGPGLAAVGLAWPSARRRPS